MLNVNFEIHLLMQNPLNLLEKPRSSIISELPLSVNIHLDGNIQLHFHKHKFCERDIERLGRTFAKAVVALVRPILTIQQ